LCEEPVNYIILCTRAMQVVDRLQRHTLVRYLAPEVQCAPASVLSMGGNSAKSCALSLMPLIHLNSSTSNTRSLLFSP